MGWEVGGKWRGDGSFNREKKTLVETLPSSGVSLFWASLQDFIPPSNCRSQLPFPTAPELLALAFHDVNYSTHGSKWVRSNVARCRITSVSFLDLGGGRRKKRGRTALGICTVVIVSARTQRLCWLSWMLSMAGERGSSGLRAGVNWELRVSTLKILVLGCTLFTTEQLALLLRREELGTFSAKPVTILPGAVVLLLSPKVGKIDFSVFLKIVKIWLEIWIAHQVWKHLVTKFKDLCMHRIFLKTKLDCSSCSLYFLMKLLFLVYWPFGELHVKGCRQPP